MSINLSALQKQRRDTAANWTAENPTLLAGEIGLESDTGYWKVGDGSTAWTSLAYVTGLGAEIPVSRLADGSARQLLQTAANGTDVEWTSNVDVPGTLDVTGAATFDAAVTIQGDLTVNGTTTTIDTQNLIVEDKNVIIGNVTTPTDVTADGGGITLKGTTDKTINWVDATDAWTLSEHVNIASGKEYRIGGTKVLDATSLGSSVLITSANITDGTIVNADVNASAAIAGTKISPNFGSQPITTTGTISGDTVTTTGAFQISRSGSAVGLLSDSGSYISNDLSAGRFIPTGSTAPTNGVYLPAANSVAISTNSTGRLFIDSSGRLGIGTSSPSGTVHAYNAGGLTSVVIGGDAASSYSQVQLRNSSAKYNWSLSAQNNVDNGFEITPSTAAGGSTFSTPAVVVKSDGKVGIGSTPVYKLDVTGGNGDAVRYLDSVNSVQNLLGAYNSAGMIGTASNHPIYFQVNSGEKARIDTSGRLLVGTSSARNDFFNNYTPSVPGFQLEGASSDSNLPQRTFSHTFGNNGVGGPIHIFAKHRGTSLGGSTVVQSGDILGEINFQGGDGSDMVEAAVIKAEVDGTPGANDMPGRLVFSTTADGASSPTERMRITNGGNVTIGSDGNTTLFNQTSVTGVVIERAGAIQLARSGDQSLLINRITNDGTLVGFYQDGTQEGTISVSGSTVSYNGAHLSRWSQLPSGQERTEILRGTVLSNIDEMCEWGEEDNEQLNRMKVSDVEGDKNVSGVFQAWDDDDDTYTNDFYCAMTGDFIIRIGAGVTVERGDLLMSAGDGTAKPQDDDIIRSKTIAKVTSTNVSCTYDDGSYCVPCVLMAC